MKEDAAISVSEPILSGSSPSFLVQLQTPLLLSALLVLLLVLSSLFSGLSQTMTELTIRVVLVVGLYVFIGNSGILSFGHVSFMSIGAYAFVWFSCCTLSTVKPLYLPGLPALLQEIALPSPVGLGAAAAVAGGSALLIGGILMRLSGTAASIATFALLAGQFALFQNWDSVTGGTSSIANVPVFMTPLVGTLLAIGAVVIAWLHQQSRFGLMLRAARDEQTASMASGVNVWLVRTIAFAISGVLMGIGGAMNAGFLGVVTVDAFYLSLTFLTFAMLIVGGSASLSGAVVGVISLTVVTEILRRLEAGVPLGDTVLFVPRGMQEVGLGITMIFVMIYRPGGIMGGREMTLPLFRNVRTLWRR
jgi:branched-chain amino acid transport system permease protein